MGKQYQIRNGVVTEITPQVAAMVPVATTTTDGLMSAADKSKLDSMAVGLSNVYLSPSGNDANDGKTAATAVATFAQAMKLAREQSYLATDVLQKQTVVVAAGSYTEDVTVDGLEQKAKYKFYLDGAVSITGDVTIANSGAAEFDNGSLTVTGDFSVNYNSYCFVGMDITTAGKLQSSESSCCEITGGDITVHDLICGNGSTMLIQDCENIEITAQFRCYQQSYMTLQGFSSIVCAELYAIRNGHIDVSLATDKASSVTCSGRINAGYFEGHIVLYGGKSAADTVVTATSFRAMQHSSAQAQFTGTLNLGGTSYTPILSSSNSYVEVNSPCTVTLRNDVSMDVIGAVENSMLTITTPVSVSATVAPATGTIVCRDKSYIRITKAMSGTVTGSKPKWVVNLGSLLEFASSAVQNSIPGGAAGTADAATFGCVAVRG